MLHGRRFQLGFGALVVSGIMMLGCGKEDAAPRAEPVTKEATDAPKKNTENAAPTTAVTEAPRAENPDAKASPSAAEPAASAAALPAKASTVATHAPSEGAAPNVQASVAAP